VTKRVSISPGISSIPTDSIPDDPTQFTAWFKSVYLPRWAANADARNAVPTSASVQISGSISSPAGIGIGPNSITNGELVQRSPLSVMGNSTGVEANVQDIIAGADGEALQRLAGSLVFAPLVPTIAVADSITGTGALASPLELIGDSAAPGNSQYYGTDVSGNRGFFPVGSSSITTLTQGGGTSQNFAGVPNAKVYDVIVIGGGGGGGSGAIEAAGTVAGGGGGGAGGGISRAIFRASDLTFPITVTFSSTTGGAGGAAKTGTNVSGAAGTVGANASFGGLLSATGGALGGAGSGAGGIGGATGGSGINAQGSAGGTGAGAATGTAGAQNVTTTGSANAFPPTGGGGGGGKTTAGVITTAAAGGALALFATISGGVAGGANNAGGNGVTGSGTYPSTGGGGGGGSITSGNAGNGGNGGGFGAGGGGGGGALNGAGASGAGGTGGPAAVIIIAY